MLTNADLAKHKRTAWKPVVEDGDGPLAGSKFSGTALVPTGEDWPQCPNCKQAMQLFVQFSTDTLPPETGDFGSGIVQLFYCTTPEPLCENDCEAYAPFSRSVLARIVDPTAGSEPTSRPTEPFPARKIVDWEPVDDYPNLEELEDAGVELTDDEGDAHGEDYPKDGDKLGGWPTWIQGVEYPACTECGAAMRLVFQIDSDDNLPYMFGDSGIGHLTQCPQHKDVMSFHWACC